MIRPTILTRFAPRRPTPWLCAGLVLALLWALGASGVILFHDEVLAGFVARQGAMRDAYEARIAGLQDRLDRSGLDRAGAEAALGARVAVALQRQGEMERRQAALAEFAAQVDAGRGPLDPASTGSLSVGRVGVGAGLELRPSDDPGPPAEPPAILPRRTALDAETGLIRLEARLDGLQAAQGEHLGRLAERADGEVRRLRGLIGRTGLDPARFAVPAPADGLGGPLVPLDARALGGPGFDGALALARRALGDGQRLRRLADALPLRRPIRGEAPVSSPFGTRLDPFTRGLALHTGLDLRAEYGAPARATAPGVVTEAERAGGYGNMVEIDHGHGLATRFGHLARIAVRPGQRVAAGEVIGTVGSTGRSTGAHLHYETRVDGEPVDPQRFLDAGRAFETAARADLD